MNINYPFRNYWLWVVAVLAVSAFFFYLPTPSLNEPARVTVRFDGDKVRAFEGPVEGGMTVLQALLSASRGGGFDVRYFLGKSGDVNLASIGEAANGQRNWHFYLNGKLVETGDIDRIKIKNGDSIEARYE